jgi:hypothetical protein
VARRKLAGTEREYAKPIDPDVAITTFDRKAASPKDWLPFFKELELSRDQGVDLAFRLRQWLQDLKQRELPTEQREHLVARVKRLGRLIRNVRDEVRRAKVDLEEALPHSVRLGLVRLMRRSAMEKAIGRSLPVWISDKDDLGALGELNEEALAIRFGVTLLEHCVSEVDEPLQAWLLADRLNRGGRATLVARDYLLLRLAFFWDTVRGTPPTPRGAFRKFCIDVFRFVELDDAGLERAVDRVVERHRVMRAKKDADV